MPTGRVKWFNNAKGYGFILPEDESEDYFVHYSSIVMDGYKTLKAGQAVSFDMIDGPKGTHAVNVQPLDSDDSAPDDPGDDPPGDDPPGDDPGDEAENEDGAVNGNSNELD